MSARVATGDDARTVVALLGRGGCAMRALAPALDRLGLRADEVDVADGMGRDAFDAAVRERAARGAVVVGRGLTACRLLGLAARCAEPRMRLIAIGPFLGFDAPFFGQARQRDLGVRRTLLRLAGMRAMRFAADRIAFLAPGCGLVADGPAPAWGAVARAGGEGSFVRAAGALRQDVLVVLDAGDADLDAVRAEAQLRAASPRMQVRVVPDAPDALADVIAGHVRAADDAQ
jgi:hypothetical protein